MVFQTFQASTTISAKATGCTDAVQHVQKNKQLIINGFDEAGVTK